MNKLLLIFLGFIFGQQANAQLVAMDYDGVNDQVVVSGNTALCPTKITLETWIYAKSFSSSPCADCAPLIWHQGKGYRFGTGNSGGVNVQLFDGSATNSLTSSATLTKNAWHHIAVTYDSAYIRLYVDGNITDSSAKAFKLSYSSTSADVWIVDPQTGYGGILEETRIWKYARTRSEIREGMMKSYKSGTNGLILQLSYDEGNPYKSNTSITTLKDGSGNGNKCILTNFRLTDSTSNFVLGRSYCDTIAYAKYSLTRCSKYVLPSKKKTITKSGTYIDTIKSWRGCDSIMTIAVTINQPSYSSTKIIACDSFVNPLNKAIYRKSGTYKVTIPNKAGCDSVITYFVTIGFKDTNFIYYRECIAATLTNGTAVNQSGTYIDKFKTYLGCDSFDYHIVTILQPSTAKRTLLFCKFVICPTNSNVSYKKPGIYYDTIQNYLGCDSAIEYTVIQANTYGTISPVSCIPWKSPSGKYTYSTSGTYHDTLVGLNFDGCDSFITINLTITQPSKMQLNPVACKSYTTPSGTQTITTSKILKDYVKGYKGCDSIEYTLNVTINNADVSYTRSMNTITANTSNTAATFSWLDCNNKMIAIAGQTSRSFSPTGDGRFALSVTENNCTDTSACIDFVMAGLSGPTLNSISIKPNPSKGAFQLTTTTSLNDVSILLINAQGQLAKSWNFTTLTGVSLEAQVAAGLWFIQIKSREGQQTLPLMIE